MSQENQDIEAVTTVIAADAGPPDSKTRRYDRQLRLWAATGQAALESAHLLVLSSTATCTSILKNLVLPGIGAFTILDNTIVSPADAGNNFFLQGPTSIGKSRAQEAVRLLCELNEGVYGYADLRSVDELLLLLLQQYQQDGKSELFKYTLIIAHNLPKPTLDRLAQMLWEDDDAPPLVVVRSAGFLAEVFIQQHEHTVIESHSETAPSLRIDKPFPALLQYAQSLDLDVLDPTEHGHVPYVIILVKAMEEWKKQHDGHPPKTYAEKNAFKDIINTMKKKSDEENFEEAEAQAYRAWTETKVPSEIQELFDDPKLNSLSASSSPFFHLLAALKKFTSEPPYTLPLTSTLPDMKATTDAYIHLQKLYKEQSEHEKNLFKRCISSEVEIDNDLIDSFVKNAHALRIIRGAAWGAMDKDTNALSNAVTIAPKQLAIHLALSALSSLSAQSTSSSSSSSLDQNEVPSYSMEALTQEARALLAPGTLLPEEFNDAVGEIVRSPTADLPNTAALLGGLVAQEVIKMVTKQYVPISGYCTIDLVETWTGML